MWTCLRVYRRGDATQDGLPGARRSQTGNDIRGIRLLFMEQHDPSGFNLRTHERTPSFVSSVSGSETVPVCTERSPPTHARPPEACGPLVPHDSFQRRERSGGGSLLLATWRRCTSCTTRPRGALVQGIVRSRPAATERAASPCSWKRMITILTRSSLFTPA
jgi:hypothetical protein